MTATDGVILYKMLSRLDKEIYDMYSGNVRSWLNENGYANLTVCPSCHVDDFTHVEGCLIADELESESE